MTVLRPSLPPASWTRTRMERSFSGAGVAASVDWTRKDGAKRLKARRPMPRLVRRKNSRRVVGRKLFGFFMVLTELIFGRLQERHDGVADAQKAAAVGAVADEEGFHVVAKTGVDRHGQEVVAQAGGKLVV